MDVFNAGSNGLPSFPDRGLPAVPEGSFWRFSPMPDGGFRVTTPVGGRLRSILGPAIVFPVIGIGGWHLARHHTPVPEMLLLLAMVVVALAPMIVLFSYGEGWRVRAGRFDLRRGYLGRPRSRSFADGAFVVTPRRPSSGPWYAARGSLIGAALVASGVLVWNAVSPRPHVGLDWNIVAVLISGILILYGSLAILWPFARWKHDTAEHARNGLQLSLRAEGGETVLIPSEYRLDAPELNVFAAWLGRETGFPVEPFA